MRRSPWLSMAACVVLMAGCQRADPADQPASGDTAASSNVIDAVPLAPDAPPPAPPAKPAAAEKEATKPAEDVEASIPEGPDMPAQPVPVSEVPCRDAIGAAASARLVERCIQVTPGDPPALQRRQSLRPDPGGDRPILQTVGTRRRPAGGVQALG